MYPAIIPEESEATFVTPDHLIYVFWIQLEHISGEGGTANQIDF